MADSQPACTKRHRNVLHSAPYGVNVSSAAVMHSMPVCMSAVLDVTLQVQLQVEAGNTGRQIDTSASPSRLAMYMQALLGA